MKHRRLAAVLYPVLLVLAGLALFVANVLIWVNNSLLDSQNFADTTSDVLQKPEVQTRIADGVSTRVVESTDIESRLTQELPPRLGFAAPVIDQQVQELLADITRGILTAPAFQGVRDQMIERLHRRVISILEDDDATLHAEGDELVVDLRPVLDRVFERLNLEEPERLKDPAATQIVLLEDTKGLKQASVFVRNRQVTALGAGTIAIVCLIGAVFIAPSRQRGFSMGAMVVLMTGIVTLALLFFTNQVLESSAADRVVLRELVRALEQELRLQSLLMIVAGGCVVLATNERTHGLLSGATERATGYATSIGTAPLLLVAGVCLGIVLFFF